MSLLYFSVRIESTLIFKFFFAFSLLNIPNLIYPSSLRNVILFRLWRWWSLYWQFLFMLTRAIKRMCFFLWKWPFLSHLSFEISKYSFFECIRVKIWPIIFSKILIMITHYFIDAHFLNPEGACREVLVLDITIQLASKS